MKTSTPRAPRRHCQIPVRTIDLFKQPKPVSYVSMSYTMSVPAPLQDPCAYAASVSGPNPPTRPANRIPQCLGPTHEETENPTLSQRRSTAGDPADRLSKLHDVEGLKHSMTIAGIPVDQYRARQPARPTDPTAQTGSMSTARGDVTIMGDTTTGESTLATSTLLVTPVRRLFEGPQGSTAKRQKTSRQSESNEGDLSSDTIRSVLRLVDESLVDTPERKAVVTPRVLRAVPGPSPREHGPTYAYASEGTQVEKHGGLVPRAASVLAPFGVVRV